MSSVCLGTIESYLFSDGSKSVEQSIKLLESLEFCVPEENKVRYNNYISAARKFSILCSDFLDVVAKNKDFVVYKILTDFVLKYPKTKQNLANPTELTSSAINFYLLKRKTSKLYKPEKDVILKFMKDNSNNIYNSIVVITNVIRAKSLIKPVWIPK